MAERPFDARRRDGELLEPQRNEQLRRVDWRFLLRTAEEPRVIDMAPGRDSEALRLVSKPAGPGEANLVLTGFPTAAALRIASDALAPGGEVVCRWWVPRLAGPQRARRRLRRAGFLDPRVYWAGPLPWRSPQFWLPLDSLAAVTRLLTVRPGHDSGAAALRRPWRLARQLGLLAPIYVVARAPGGEEDGDRAGSGSAMLLTGGHRSINKVVALDFQPGNRGPRAASKFARVAEAEPGLEREADVLSRLAEEGRSVEGVPVLRGRQRRCGRVGVVEGTIEGDSLLDRLTPTSFAEMARRVNDLLIEIAGKGPGADQGTGVRKHLELFEHRFGFALTEDNLATLRAAVGRVADLPVVCEHRDCSPWNVILAARDRPALLDWESAAPDGLPGLDLVYFLANSAFVLDGALERGTTRESYRRLLDSTTAYGEIAAAETERYCEALGLDPAILPSLRLLCWMIHCHSDYEHLRLAAAGEPAPEDLRQAPFLGLVLEELEGAQL